VLRVLENEGGEKSKPLKREHPLETESAETSRLLINKGTPDSAKQKPPKRKKGGK